MSDSAIVEHMDHLTQSASNGQKQMLYLIKGDINLSPIFIISFIIFLYGKYAAPILIYCWAVYHTSFKQLPSLEDIELLC